MICHRFQIYTCVKVLEKEYKPFINDTSGVVGAVLHCEPTCTRHATCFSVTPMVMQTRKEIENHRGSGVKARSRAHSARLDDQIN